jgi:hypothetical protein
MIFHVFICTKMCKSVQGRALHRVLCCSARPEAPNESDMCVTRHVPRASLIMDATAEARDTYSMRHPKYTSCNNIHALSHHDVFSYCFFVQNLESIVCACLHLERPLVHTHLHRTATKRQFTLSY